MNSTLRQLIIKTKIGLFIPIVILTFTACDSDHFEDVFVDVITGSHFVPDNYPGTTVDTTELSNECEEDGIPLSQAHYPFDGNAEDISDYENHGSLTGVTNTTDRFGNAESALLFNGIDDIVEISDQDHLHMDDEMTISVWVYPEEIKDQYIVRKGSLDEDLFQTPFSLHLTQSKEVIFSINTDTNIFANPDYHGYSQNEWMMVTGVFNNNLVYLYINGELVAVRAAIGRIIDDESPFLIGGRLSQPSNSLKGKIDDVRFWNSALCEEDILELYEQ